MFSAAKLRQARQEAGWSRDELAFECSLAAERLGLDVRISARSIARWEGSRNAAGEWVAENEPRYDHLGLLAIVIKKPPDFFSPISESDVIRIVGENMARQARGYRQRERMA